MGYSEQQIKIEAAVKKLGYELISNTYEQGVTLINARKGKFAIHIAFGEAEDVLMAMPEEEKPDKEDREDKGDFIGTNQEDLTETERLKLINLDLSWCDICGDIDHSTSLRWIDSEEYWEDPTALRLMKDNVSAVCTGCWNDERKKDKSPEN